MNEKLRQFGLCFLAMISFLSCTNPNARRFEDFNPDDFVPVQGIIYKVTRTPVTPRYSLYSSKFNAYYIYNLDSEQPKLGKEMDVQILIEEGMPSVILVHKDNDNISFVGRGRIINKKLLEKYLMKSKSLGVEYYGLE